MIPESLVLLLFLIGLFLLLTFIAFYFNLLTNYFTNNSNENFFIRNIETISYKINSVELSEETATKIMSICPVEAITLVNPSEIQLMVSDAKCLGYACLRCVQLLLTEN